MNRLANIERGLSLFAIRQLYLACIVSIADYGSIVWWRGQKGLIRPFQALQNLALRKILGVFKTAPILPMEVEAALVPPLIRLDTNIQQYRTRLTRLSKNHPINQEIIRNKELLKVKKHQKYKTPLVQLDYIQRSVPNIKELDLEVLQHFKFTPWELDIPFTVAIS